MSFEQLIAKHPSHWEEDFRSNKPVMLIKLSALVLLLDHKRASDSSY
jgi:hypothetical protein